MALKLGPTGLGSGIDKDRQDFTIYSGGWAMGRIYEQRGGPDSMRWFWSLHGIFGKPADMRADGHAATLERGQGRAGRSCVRTRSSYAATDLAALPLGGSRRLATEVDSSIFAEGLCFLAAPKRGERPHQRQSEPNFSLRLLVS